jgi:hypothetical protein
MKLDAAWLKENPGAESFTIASAWRPRKWSSKEAYEKDVLSRRYSKTEKGHVKGELMFSSVEEAGRWVAYESPHETGLAIDFGNNGLFPERATNEAQKRTRAYLWLKDNAFKFGFTPYKVEAWHWEVRIPKENWVSGEEFTDNYSVMVKQAGDSSKSFLPAQRDVIEGEECLETAGTPISFGTNETKTKARALGAAQAYNEMAGDNTMASGALTEMEKKTLIEKLSGELGIAPEVAYAFFKVESGGRSGFCKETNAPLIRFEPHVFASPDRMKKSGVNPAQVPWAGNSNAERKQKWLDLGYRHGSSCGTNHYEYDALKAAIQINEELAYQSISVGSAQIMGFNCRSVGYPTAKAMFEAYSKSEEAQIRGFFLFVKKREGGNLLKALQSGDFLTAAVLYNGKSSQAPLYASKIQKNYDEYKTKGIPA